jgi:glycosyltransferase involved in cell wall biosynthesis
MNVLVVTNMFAGENPRHSSQGTFVSEQVAALRRLPGMEIDVLVVKGFASRLAYAASLFDVLRRLRSKQYDVVHYHFGLTAWSAPVVRMLTRVRIVVTLHGSDVFGRSVLRRITRIAVRFAHVCIAVSDEIRTDIAPLVRSCTTIPCAVDDTVFRPLERRAATTSARTIVFPSSASRPEKDYPLFAASLERLRSISNETIVERRIENMSRIEVRDLLQHADALAMTSQREGSPQVVKEAMACGLPIVSVNVGDVAALLNGVDGCRIVERRDPESIAAALLDVLASDRPTNGPARLAEAGYLSTDIARRVQTLYRNVLASRINSAIEGAYEPDR